MKLARLSSLVLAITSIISLVACGGCPDWNAESTASPLQHLYLNFCDVAGCQSVSPDQRDRS